MRSFLKELKKTVSGIQPEWKSIKTVQTVTCGKASEQKSQKILAQCCKPGPCSPKSER